MRVIKFRAWDEIDSEFVNTIGMDISLLSLNTKYKFTQYTGLKDNNDNGSCDVYEHDILTNGTGNFYKVEWDYRDTGWCGIQINNTKKHRLVNLLLRDSIVVGNIYENKDLLK